MIDVKTRENLVAYLDGELDPEEAASIERLIREDPAVDRELRSLRETDGLLDLYVAPELRTDLAPRVVARARRRRRMLRLVPAVALAASMLILAGILGLLSGGEPAKAPASVDSDVQMAIENLHALEYMALAEEAGEDVDALLEDADFILALIEEDVEVR